MAQFVSMYNFDGVSIDFDDFNSVKDKTASAWLTTLLKTLRKQIGKNKLIVLQFYPTFIS
jgi:chitinase